MLSDVKIVALKMRGAALALLAQASGAAGAGFACAVSIRLRYPSKLPGGAWRRLADARTGEEPIMRLRWTIAVAVALAVAWVTVPPAAAQPAASLKNPAALKETAPATYKARFDTSAGAFVVEVNREWAPHGADRFYNLVKNGFYNDCRFFRVIQGFMVQFGINGDPAISGVWRNAQIPVDPVKQSNKRGYITYAMGASPSTRTTQVFINFRDNSNLDSMGFAPFGQVVEGMDVVDKISTVYGEGAPRGKGPDQGRVQSEGNAYLIKSFPKLDYIKTATVE
jgi:peptidyl-prolyl cis-trans isomerase A (cyclophilin A)